MQLVSFVELTRAFAVIRRSRSFGLDVRLKQSGQSPARRPKMSVNVDMPFHNYVATFISKDLVCLLENGGNMDFLRGEADIFLSAVHVPKSTPASSCTLCGTVFLHPFSKFYSASSTTGREDCAGLLFRGKVASFMRT